MTTKLSGRPRPDSGEGGMATPISGTENLTPSPVPSRCPVVICDLRRDGRNSKSGKEKRVRCIQPKDHWGPHVFGGVR
jgi:hypothetical protein